MGHKKQPSKSEETLWEPLSAQEVMRRWGVDVTRFCVLCEKFEIPVYQTRTGPRLYLLYDGDQAIYISVSPGKGIPGGPRFIRTHKEGIPPEGTSDGFLALVEEHKAKHGTSKGEAIKAIVHSHPEAHETYLLQYNPHMELRDLRRRRHDSRREREQWRRVPPTDVARLLLQKSWVESLEAEHPEILPVPKHPERVDREDRIERFARSLWAKHAWIWPKHVAALYLHDNPDHSVSISYVKKRIRKAHPCPEEKRSTRPSDKEREEYFRRLMGALNELPGREYGFDSTAKLKAVVEPT